MKRQRERGRGWGGKWELVTQQKREAAGKSGRAVKIGRAGSRNHG